MDKTHEATDILMNSLALLGVNIPQASRDYGCDIRQGMFVHANQKGLNAMLHLLLERIRGRDTLKKELKGMWPVKDSVHQREFNKTVHKVVTGLLQQGYMPKHMAAYLLQGFRQLSGARITAILCYLAAYALMKTGASSQAQTAFTFRELSGSAASLELLYRCLRSQTSLERKSFVASLSRMSASEAEWTAAVEKLGQIHQLHWSTWTQHTQESASVPNPSESVEPEHSERGRDGNSGDETTEESGIPSVQQNLKEAAAKAQALWTSVIEGASRQQELKTALEAVVAANKHPYEISGAKLQQASGESKGSSVNAPHVDLRHLLQDWQKLVENYKEVIPTSECLEGMERIGREIAPLLAPTQQKQICSLGMQHHSRLQSQKQLFDNLQQALASAVQRREALQAQARRAAAQAEPGSPLKDLIPASYPDMQASTQQPLNFQSSRPSMLKLTGDLRGIQKPSLNTSSPPPPLPPPSAGSDSICWLWPDETPPAALHLSLSSIYKSLSILAGAAEDGCTYSNCKQLDPGAKASAIITRADLCVPAARSIFQGSMQLLRPYEVNTQVEVLRPAMSTAAFDPSFLPASTDHEAAGCAKQLDIACQAFVEGPQQAEVSSAQKPAVLVEVKADARGPLTQPAAPRRLSFSGISPATAAGKQSREASESLPESLSPPSDEGGEQLDSDPVAVIMARMNRLHA